MANNDRRYAVWSDFSYKLQNLLKDFNARLADNWINTYPFDVKNIEIFIIPRIKEALVYSNSMLIASINEQNTKLTQDCKVKIKPCKLSEQWNKEEKQNEPVEVSDE